MLATYSLFSSRLYQWMLWHFSLSSWPSCQARPAVQPPGQGCRLHPSFDFTSWIKNNPECRLFPRCGGRPTWQNGARGKGVQGEKWPCDPP
jgi:hypothetical protein